MIHERLHRSSPRMITQGSVEFTLVHCSCSIRPDFPIVFVVEIGWNIGITDLFLNGDLSSKTENRTLRQNLPLTSILSWVEDAIKPTYQYQKSSGTVPVGSSHEMPLHVDPRAGIPNSGGRDPIFPCWQYPRGSVTSEGALEPENRLWDGRAQSVQTDTRGSNRDQCIMSHELDTANCRCPDIPRGWPCASARANSAVPRHTVTLLKKRM